MLGVAGLDIHESLPAGNLSSLRSLGADLKVVVDPAIGKLAGSELPGRGKWAQRMGQIVLDKIETIGRLSPGSIRSW
jgi:hypothetical protein